MREGRRGQAGRQWAALSALVTQEKEESREREKQRKAFIYVSPNLLRLRRQSASEDGGGRERAEGGGGASLAAAGLPFNGGILPLFLQTHTHTSAPGGFPLGVPG